MENENTIKINDLFSSDEQTDTIKSESLKMVLPLKRSGFEDEKEFNRFIKSVERLVRGSIEYKEFITFTRESLNANICSFTGESEEETGDVEIHHYPLTLFDIVKAVIDDYIYNDKEFSSFDIANDVIKLHFQLKVGFVPLIGTLHKKFHKGNLEIPIEYVLGDYEYLANSTNLSPELKNKIESAKKLTVNTVQKLEWKPKIVISNNTQINENEKLNNDIIKKSEELQKKENNQKQTNNIMNEIDLGSLLSDNP